MGATRAGANAHVNSGVYTQGGSFSAAGRLSVLGENAPLVLFGAVRYAFTGEVALLAYEVTTRLRPTTAATLRSVGQRSVDVGLVVDQSDPMPGLPNEFSAAWAVVRAGEAVWGWLVPHDPMDPLEPQAWAIVHASDLRIPVL
jgi:hypothetical protein